MRLPTFHHNGTNKQTLLDEYRKAYMSVSDAIYTVGTVTVHGRDYYPQGDGALAEAQKQHRDRIVRLTSVKEELEQMIIEMME